jgi:cobalamin biosynthetic protein CobC
VLGPTYGEFAHAAALAGHHVTEVEDIEQLRDADLAVVANPNNPNGRVLKRDELLDLAKARGRRGLLVVDEAFMDVGPVGASLGGEVARHNIVVLRSFGKFFGLAGLRLGFALAKPEIATRLAAALGPWAVSGPAIAIGEIALADYEWAKATRKRLEGEAQRLDAALAGARIEVLGGTPLFRLLRTSAAGSLCEHLGRAGILVRRFPEHPMWLRIGLPGNEASWDRLSTALAAWEPSITASSSARRRPRSPGR